MKTYLEPKEIDRIEQAAECLRDKLLVRLLARLGCRVSEALGIRIDDIDFDQGTVRL
jgi:integrase/recombinase XerD